MVLVLLAIGLIVAGQKGWLAGWADQAQDWRSQCPRINSPGILQEDVLSDLHKRSRV